MENNKLLVNDFFCGCGGMGLGFQQAGYSIVGAWDWDKYAVKSYRANVGEHVQQADITQMVANDIPPSNVWTFGFPCQDISVAGSQKGLVDGNRSRMFFEVMRLLDETQVENPHNMPQVLLAENVKQLRKYLPIVEYEFAKRGYRMFAKLYNSKYWGVPQNRERYFIIGVKTNIAPSTFNHPTEQHFFIPKLSSILQSNVDEKYYINDDKARQIIQQALERVTTLGNVHATLTVNRVDKRQNGRRAKEDEEAMFTLTAQDLHGVIQSVFTTNDGAAYCCDANYHKGTSPGDIGKGRRTHVVELVESTGVIMSKYATQLDRLSDVSSCLQARDYKGFGNQQMTGVLEIQPQTAVGGGGHEAKIFDYSRYRVRKLTPLEYGRLQAFPMDTWQQVVSDSQAYKQFGNAVTVSVAKANALAIKDFLAKRVTQ